MGYTNKAYMEYFRILTNKTQYLNWKAYASYMELNEEYDNNIFLFKMTASLSYDVIMTLILVENYAFLDKINYKSKEKRYQKKLNVLIFLESCFESN